MLRYKFIFDADIMAAHGLHRDYIPGIENRKAFNRDKKAPKRGLTIVHSRGGSQQHPVAMIDAGCVTPATG